MCGVTNLSNLRREEVWGLSPRVRSYLLNLPAVPEVVGSISACAELPERGYPHFHLLIGLSPRVRSYPELSEGVSEQGVELFLFERV